MYNIVLHNCTNKYGYDELVKVFLNPDDFNIFFDDDEENTEVIEGKPDIELTMPDDADKNFLKRELYKKLQELTGQSHEWGILTGVRPAKLAGEIACALGSYDETEKKLREEYFLSAEKAHLITDTYRYQQEKLGKPPAGSVGIYIGIPFCPTRCLYCSFASNQVKDSEIARYLVALHKEIDFVADGMKKKGWYPESIYIGGGTPTTLNAEQLDELISHVQQAFDVTKLKEFTIEAGRPDTIDKDKLRVIKERGVDRISINPQTMKDKTLEIIGRSHKADDIERAFTEAKETAIPCINADVIAGLPEEDADDFERTLNKIIAMGAENITVHTLAVKRASRLIDIDKNFHYKQAEIVKEQLSRGNKILAENGYRPYYLYRQKHMAGGLENVGYCKDDTLSIYNIRIMEEMQTIVALGAGGISKVYYEDENRLERVPNVTNYEIYIERLDEMLERKDKNMFQEENKC